MFYFSPFTLSKSPILTRWSVKSWNNGYGLLVDIPENLQVNPPCSAWMIKISKVGN